MMKHFIKKVIHFRFLSVLLILSLVLGQLFLLSAVLAAESAPLVGLHVANRVDVALAVGPTSVDYSRFEADLRAALNAKPHPIPHDDLFITASQAVAANTTSEFTWWVYDHTMPGALSALNAGGVAGVKYKGVEIIDDTAHRYVEVDNAANQTTSSTQGTIQATNPAGVTYTPHPLNPDIGKTWHPYIGILSHMIESNSGATMDFYGYSTHSFKDFRFLPNDQKTIKTFEFAIAEDLAFDAIDGVGFFFNTDITGSYAAGTQTMSGYLLFLQYTTSGVGSEMAIYKFDGINTKDFHHARAATSGGGLAAFSDRSSKKFVKVASSTVYKAGDFSRRIKIEVSPTSVQAWYAGSNIKNNSAVLTTPIDQTAAPVSFTMTANGQPGQTSGTSQKVWLNESIIHNYGFGPMSSYIGHGCARPTHIALQNLSMTVEKVRTLPEVIRDPEWHADTLKFLVNLNEQEIEDFSVHSITSELLARLTADDIYYIGWCADINAQESLAFLEKHNLKGTVVNIEEDITDTYQKQIEAIADEIYARYWQDNESTVFLVTDKVELDVTGASRYNTAVPEWPDGKWMVLHRSTAVLGWDSGDEGPHPLSGQYMSDLEFAFQTPGEYDIYYKDTMINTVTAHRAPVASFEVDLTDPEHPVFTNTSYDPDDLSAGIVDFAFTWLDINTMTAPLPGVPDQLEPDHLYLITLTVTDKLGATASAARQISVSTEQSTEKTPPYAAFTLTPASIMKGVGNQNITIQNTSYDVYGSAITSSFSVKKDGLDFAGLVIAGEGTGSYDTAALDLPAGSYRIYLTVESEHGVSQTVSQGFDIIVDDLPPTALASPATDTFFSNQDVTLTFSDSGGSGFYRQQFVVSGSSVFPAGDITWSSFSSSATRFVNINTVGINYIHWQAWDYAGNKGTGTFGPYTLEKSPTTLTLTADPPDSNRFGDFVTLTATLTSGTYDAGSRIYFYSGALLLGGAEIVGNTASLSFTPTAAETLTLSAEFLGDATHNGSGDSLSYIVTKSDAATASLSEQTGRPYNAGPFEPSGVTVTGATSYKLVYEGTNGTDYGPSATPPKDAGQYVVTLTTTDPNYDPKSASQAFSITPLTATISLSATVGEQTVVSGEALDTVTLWAVMTNAVDLPGGSISFYIDGTLLDTVSLSSHAGTYKAITSAWAGIPAGDHNITAVYNSIPHDNYAPGQAAILSFSASKLNQTGFGFAEGATKTVVFGDAPFALPAITGGSSSGALTVDLVSGSDVVSYDPLTGTLRILKTGTAVLTATKEADGYYNQATATITITVLRAEDVVDITVPDIQPGDSLSVNVTTLGGGLLTYSYTGRNDTVYGPTDTPPTAVGDYTVTVTSAQVTNYLAGTGSADFTIRPCDRAITALDFDGEMVEIPSDQPQTSVLMQSAFAYHLCNHHAAEFATAYTLAGSAHAAAVHGDLLTVNTRAVGTTVEVLVTVTHIPTGITAANTAYFPVTRGANPEKFLDKNTEHELVFDIVSFDDEVETVTVGGKEIVLGDDYILEDGKLIILKKALDLFRPHGGADNQVAIHFKAGDPSVFVVNVKEGDLSFAVTVADKLPGISIKTPAETILAMLVDRDEYSMIDQGYNVHIELVVDEAQSADEVDALKHALDNRTAGVVLDVSIFKSVAGDKSTKILALPSPITVSLKLPETMQRHARYWALRAHTSGAGSIHVSALKSALTSGGEFEFETDLFSTIAIVYDDDTVIGHETDYSGTAQGPGTGYFYPPKTGESVMLGLWFLLTGISGMGLVLLSRKRRPIRLAKISRQQ